MDNEQQTKWRCKFSVHLSTEANKVWHVLADFFTIDKWLSFLIECRAIKGTTVEPGCIRCCVSSTGVFDSNGKEIVTWAKETLLWIDHTARSFSYEMNENNLGFKGYKATMTVIPTGYTKEDGCRIEWSFVVDPVKGRTYNNLVSFQQSVLKTMAKTIDKAHIDYQ
ncbi:hypothetical protein ACHQM5_005701 [Ranunculus cassubicifolius]